MCHAGSIEITSQVVFAITIVRHPASYTANISSPNHESNLKHRDRDMASHSCDMVAEMFPRNAKTHYAL
jgi:hypothetical protein